MEHIIYSVPAQIQETVNNHNDIIDKFKSQADIMEARSRDIPAKWEGKAAEAFMGDMKRKIDFFNDNINLMRQVVDFEKRTLERYNRAEQRVRTIIES